MQLQLDYYNCNRLIYKNKHESENQYSIVIIHKFNEKKYINMCKLHKCSNTIGSIRSQRSVNIVSVKLVMGA